MKKKNDPLKGLNRGPTPPNLELHQIVKVIKGKHKGKSGKVYYYQPGRITLNLDDGTTVYVDKEDINFKFESVSINLMMDEEERAYLKELARAYRDGECHS